MGYGGTITGAPIDFFAWRGTYPYNYMTNYGGRYQFSVMPNYYTPQMAFNMQNVFNPYYQYSRMMNNFYRIINPFMNMNMQNMAVYQDAYTRGQQMGNVIAFNTNAKTLAGNLSSLKSQLNQALTSEQLTAEQKEELKALKKEIETLENKLEQIGQLAQRGATNEQLKAALTELENNYTELRTRVQAAAKRIQEAIQNNNNDDDRVQNDDETDVPPGDTPDSVSDSEINDEVSNVDVATFNENIVIGDVDNENVRQIVNNIYQKVDGAGSSDIKTYLDENINKDNVVEVMLLWNKSFAEMYKEDDPHGLTETLMDERLTSGRKICTKILTSLEERLKDYQGINDNLYNEASAQLAIARREHDAIFWTSEDKMSEAINKAHKNIVMLMALKAQQ